MILTVDPSYQYVKANGGGTVTAHEVGCATSIRPAARAERARPPADAGQQRDQDLRRRLLRRHAVLRRVDVNGDGDMLDTVTVLAPSQTRTYRYGLIAGLRWDINDDHTVRVNYTLDHAHHRQTGEVGLLNSDRRAGRCVPDQRPADSRRAIGVNLQKRDRKSFAILHQVSGEYRGEFFDNRLTVNPRRCARRSSLAS